MVNSYYWKLCYLVRLKYDFLFSVLFIHAGCGDYFIILLYIDSSNLSYILLSFSGVVAGVVDDARLQKINDRILDSLMELFA